MNEFSLPKPSPFDGYFPDGHPIRTYMEENILINKYISKLKLIDIDKELELYTEIFEKLATINLHFIRKENQLFPYLEKHGWTSPSQNMWAMHDDIRDYIKAVRGYITAKDISNIGGASKQLFTTIEHLLSVEEGRLFPNAMQMLSEDEWREFKDGDKEIGWMFEKDPTPYPKDEYVHPSEDTQKRKLPFGIDDKTHYDEGYLTPEQVNSIFRILPVDITYVNENDQVVFYNRGEDRVFPRSAGIIGREVRFCHPPKSVDQVIKILEEFKAGRQDLAEFWINFKGQFIHIQYFPVRDSDGTYRGVIEMSQDVTHIRSLEGEKRLLDWE